MAGCGGCFPCGQTQRKSLRVLKQFAELRKEDKNARASQLFSKDAAWFTLYQDRIDGREAILQWLEEEKEKGRTNIEEDAWVPERHDSVDAFRRNLTVLFPSQSKHMVVQRALMERGEITQITVEPRFKAHEVVLNFGLARQSGNDDQAVQLMSEQILWKTFDGDRITGKSQIRILFAEQRSRREKREGKSDFEPVGTVGPEGGSFMRQLQIDAEDGTKHRTEQTVTVALAEMSVLKIVEVTVNSEAVFKDGEWIENTRSPRRRSLSQKLVRDAALIAESIAEVKVAAVAEVKQKASAFSCGLSGNYKRANG